MTNDHNLLALIELPNGNLLDLFNVDMIGETVSIGTESRQPWAEELVASCLKSLFEPIITLWRVPSTTDKKDNRFLR